MFVKNVDAIYFRNLINLYHQQTLTLNGMFLIPIAAQNYMKEMEKKIKESVLKICNFSQFIIFN